MSLNLDFAYFDLTTPDAVLTSIDHIDDGLAEGVVAIEGISPHFVGFELDPHLVFFNVKSVLAQVGVDAHGTHYELDKARGRAVVQLRISGIGSLGKELLALLTPGMFVGKLFAADERRRVRDPFYLSRMFGRSDRGGNSLLSLGGMDGSGNLVLEKIDGRAVAYLALQNGHVVYDSAMSGFLKTLAKGLKSQDTPMRSLLKLNQVFCPQASRIVQDQELLLVKTQPLHIRTVFAHVIDELLPPGYRHTSASILQPDTFASGDIYELYGTSQTELTEIPLEFYTLEPYREHVFFQDRDQLKACIEEESTLFKALETAPMPYKQCASVFIAKGEQLLNLQSSDWVTSEIKFLEFPGMMHEERQALMVEKSIQKQSSYPFLKAIDEGSITSQGILLTRYFPSPLLKRMLLSERVQQKLKGIYFEQPSLSNDDFFSHEDRALLTDLVRFAIPVFWVDRKTKRLLQYVQKRDKDAGMFVPIGQVESYLKATVFGIYGSNLFADDFEMELQQLLGGVLALRQEVAHPLLGHETPLALVTGGGPGAMEMGNRIAKQTGILSCANLVDFRPKDGSVVNEQRQNSFVEAKMTYRLDKIVERQAEFHLHFPIFLKGGIGTDFEFCLEEVRRKVGGVSPTPIILFGGQSFWEEKITSRFHCNLAAKTIEGSEWISNCFYCVENAEQALKVYRAYFQGSLPIGKGGPVYPKGFAIAADLF
ncbi:MAG: hypothetical protein K0S07_1665 [Chlamydiales bacterium]|jgi:predicted Rossmann-fold nucleotide-binding protein|nr:hypothetical protein [Chlamydiales bacterium]